MAAVDGRPRRRDAMPAAAAIDAPQLSVVIVARDEAAALPLLLADLGTSSPLLREVLVVDGGSRDATALVARLGGARLIRTAPGRGLQLRAGVAASDGAWLLLLHADVRLPRHWDTPLARAMAAGERQAWAFRLGIGAPGLDLRLVEMLVAFRCRWRNLPYGDQGLLISRSWLEAVGGIAAIPLMEDLELVLRLRRHGPIGVLPARIQVSARRWRRLGVIGTALSNARLRAAWRRGIPAEELAVRYRRSGGPLRRRTRRRSAAAGAPAPSPEPHRTPGHGDRRTD